MNTLYIVVIAVLAMATVEASAQSSRKPTGAEQICVNRCYVKGWPPRCYEDCMSRSR